MRPCSYRFILAFEQSKVHEKLPAEENSGAFSEIISSIRRRQIRRRHVRPTGHTACHKLFEYRHGTLFVQSRSLSEYETSNIPTTKRFSELTRCLVCMLSGRTSDCYGLDRERHIGFPAVAAGSYTTQSQFDLEITWETYGAAAGLSSPGCS